jgi:hypothetical protein
VAEIGSEDVEALVQGVVDRRERASLALRADQALRDPGRDFTAEDGELTRR